MRQLLVDVPIAMVDGRLDAELAALPLRITPRPGAGAMLGATLRTNVERFMQDPVEGEATRFADYTRQLVVELIDVEVNGANASRASLSYLLTAKQYIATHLGEPELAPQAVADAVGLSLRHLSRLFAAEGESITQHIWSERLSHAYRDLTDARLRKTSVGEIAFRWGFQATRISAARSAIVMAHRRWRCATRCRPASADTSRAAAPAARTPRDALAERALTPHSLHRSAGYRPDRAARAAHRRVVQVAQATWRSRSAR